MSVEWPATLPLPQFGLRYNVVDPQMRTLMASGRTISRRRFSDVPTDFSARWMLRQSEAEIFEQFYQNDAVDGSEWIEMPLVTAQGEGVHYVRFRGAYQCRRVGADLWEYSAILQMYLRPGSPEWPPVIGGGVSPPAFVPDDAIDITHELTWSYSVTDPDPESADLQVGAGWPTQYAARATKAVNGGVRITATSSNFNESFTGIYFAFATTSAAAGGQAQYSFSKAGSGLSQPNTNAGAETLDEKIFEIAQVGSYSATISGFVVSVGGSFYARTLDLIGVWITQ